MPRTVRFPRALSACEATPARPVLARRPDVAGGELPALPIALVLFRRSRSGLLGSPARLASGGGSRPRACETPARTGETGERAAGAQRRPLGRPPTRSFGPRSQTRRPAARCSLAPRHPGSPTQPTLSRSGKAGRPESPFSGRACAAFSCTERRWNRTIQAWGCHALPVLKTGLARTVNRRFAGLPSLGQPPCDGFGDGPRRAIGSPGQSVLFAKGC